MTIPSTSNLLAPSPKSEEAFDPQAPFIASDGLEYGCVADKILNHPLDTWRNREVQQRRVRHEPEARIRAWIKLYDGEAYNGPICLDRKLAARDADYAFRWHDHCSRAARGVVF